MSALPPTQPTSSCSVHRDSAVAGFGVRVRRPIGLARPNQRTFDAIGCQPASAVDELGHRRSVVALALAVVLCEHECDVTSRKPIPVRNCPLGDQRIQDLLTDRRKGLRHRTQP
jgi:hypothetical protein